MQSEVYYCELEKEEISKKENKEILINLRKVFSNRKRNISNKIKISKVFIFSNGINTNGTVLL